MPITTKARFMLNRKKSLRRFTKFLYFLTTRNRDLFTDLCGHSITDSSDNFIVGKYLKKRKKVPSPSSQSRNYAREAEERNSKERCISFALCICEKKPDPALATGLVQTLSHSGQNILVIRRKL